MPGITVPPPAIAFAWPIPNFLEVERDFTVYGEEVKFGGGKVIRDGQGQSPLPTPAASPNWMSSSPTRWFSITAASSRATSAFATAGSSASARPATR